MPKFLQLFMLVISLTWETAAAQEPTLRTEVLSKDDARAVFAMSKTEWRANLEGAIASGAARAAGLPTELGLVLTLPTGGILMVIPHYNKGATSPDLVSVTVGYPNDISTHLTQEALLGAVRAAEVQMMPEYIVFGGVSKLDAGMSITFVITPSESP